jgi:uncharacterized protein YprB with RNaseH-like and TPR domain
MFVPANDLRFIQKSKELLSDYIVDDKVIDILDKKTAVVRVNGKVFEKPHIKRIVNIMKWKNKYGTQ